MVHQVLMDSLIPSPLWCTSGALGFWCTGLLVPWAAQAKELSILELIYTSVVLQEWLIQQIMLQALQIQLRTNPDPALSWHTSW